MIAWKALSNYGFHNEAEECAYRWCFAITKNFNETGIVPEKFDVVSLKLRGDVEYGVEGDQFEGFGWMNASFLVGLGYLGKRLRKFLDEMADPKDIFYI